MSLFNRILASIGIGAATVDTKLAKDSFQVGEIISGVVNIQGGQIEQKIDNIYLYLMTQVVKEIDDKKVRENVVLDTFKITNPITLKGNETKEIPFSFVLPFETPITMGKTNVWIKTGLDIKNALDPSDNDFIKVNPHPIAKALLDAAGDLGFRIREVECEYNPRLRGHQPIIQEFEFVPTNNFRGYLDELEMIFLVEENDVEVFLQIDKKARGLFGALQEALNLDEHYVRLRLTQSDIKVDLSQRLSQLISSKL